MTSLRQRQIMHARLSGGALYGYEITDAARGGKVVGTKSIIINKKVRPWTETATYVLVGSEDGFANARDFIAAYEAKLKREEGR